MTKRAMKVMGPLALVLVMAAPAGAQVTGAQAAPFLEFSVGYQVLHRGGDDSSTYPVGFAIDGARYWGPVGVVAELGWSRDSTDVPNASISSNYLHVAGGGRFLFVRDGRVRPHLQVLGGISRASFASSFASGGMTTVLESSDTAFMLQPGIGVTFATAETVALAIGVDYRRAFFDEGAGLGFSDTNEIRFVIGIRFSME
jgi:hypothetical protein